jgi:acyl-CoA hydrolase
MTEVQIPQREKRLTMSLLMTPDKANFSGNVHGGEMMKMLDEVAYACASRYCGNYVVTVNDDGKPVPVESVVLDSPDDRRRHEGATMRREFRREIQKRNEEIRATCEEC